MADVPSGPSLDSNPHYANKENKTGRLKMEFTTKNLFRKFLDTLNSQIYRAPLNFPNDKIRKKRVFII
jgi:hypothetical protein